MIHNPLESYVFPGDKILHRDPPKKERRADYYVTSTTVTFANGEELCIEARRPHSASIQNKVAARILLGLLHMLLVIPQAEKVLCPECNGQGICPSCDGNLCQECEGLGRCPSCRGRGEVAEERLVDNDGRPQTADRKRKPIRRKV